MRASGCIAAEPRDPLAQQHPLKGNLSMHARGHRTEMRSDRYEMARAPAPVLHRNEHFTVWFTDATPAIPRRPSSYSGGHGLVTNDDASGRTTPDDRMRAAL